VILLPKSLSLQMFGAYKSCKYYVKV